MPPPSHRIPAFVTYLGHMHLTTLNNYVPNSHKPKCITYHLLKCLQRFCQCLLHPILRFTEVRGMRLVSVRFLNPTGNFQWASLMPAELQIACSLTSDRRADIKSYLELCVFFSIPAKMLQACLLPPGTFAYRKHLAS